ncbi:S41 family peptidase [Agathobaculum sp.]|uniref:S41 family peptidase n=1 Tax=Agathobaculum sp. TaxID=2048138 RepID=UPI003AF16E09
MKNLRKIRVPLAAAVLLCFVSAGASLGAGTLFFGWKTGAVQVKLREIDRLAADKYIGEIDSENVADYAAVGYVTGLGDKWSSYIPADQYEAYRMSSEGTGCGIGVSVTSTADTVRISIVYDDSPAAQAGIVKGDYILGAEGLTVEKDGANAVISAIRGEEGTDVSVTIQTSAGETETKTLTMKRATVTQKMAWGEMLSGNTGYIRIENFHTGVADQFQKALSALEEQGMTSLVIDVRHNGGGKVKEMSEVLDPLLPEGTIMTLREKNGHETVYSSDADMIDLPLAVLIDDQSISAAEFFAAALQEYERATLVGTHTTGKGRAQRTYALSDGSAVNLSVEEYFTPKGKSLADTGIAPDIETTLTNEQTANFYFLGTDGDPQLTRAVSVLQGAEK